MKIRSNLVFVIGILIGVFLILLIISQLSSALQPKLLKEVPDPFVLENSEYASHSGHLIIEDKDHKYDLEAIAREARVLALQHTPRTFVDGLLSLLEKKRKF